MRVVNTPVRGIGKATIEVLERLALEAGLSLWGAVGEAIPRQLLPVRACAALKNFRDLIEDGRAMLGGTYAQRLEQTAKTEKEAAPAAVELDDQISFDPTMFDFAAIELEEAQPATEVEKVEGFPEPGSAGTADILKFLIDRTGYIKLLEEEDTPEAFSRVENLQELVNAAMDSRDRGETLDQFLDHAALVSDADAYDEQAQITLMTLHAAKGLEFPLVFLCGLEEGLFPHSRTFNHPDDVEEERRLCYVGMTRAMDALVLSRATYRRRYGTDLPEASIPSRFLEEVPAGLLEEVGGRGSRASRQQRAQEHDSADTHYSYEDEDQSVSWRQPPPAQAKAKTAAAAPKYNSIENIAEFFASRGKRFTVPKVPVEAPTGRRGFRPGQKVRHPKYGEGTVYQREGEGEDTKLTVQFPRFGLKKLVEKYAQLEAV
jgi:DNA helicase-2/ATP-dependent DNA helicase PcrA